jgi:hypothetical protein
MAKATIIVTPKPRIGYKLAVNVFRFLCFIRVISIDRAASIIVKHMIKMECVYE